MFAIGGKLRLLCEGSVLKGLCEPAGSLSHWPGEVKLGFTEELTAEQRFQEVRVSHGSKVGYKGDYFKR